MYPKEPAHVWEGEMNVGLCPESNCDWNIGELVPGKCVLVLGHGGGRVLPEN